MEFISSINDQFGIRIGGTMHFHREDASEEIAKEIVVFIDRTA